MKKWAPAKINLNLRILGKRADGFHELNTLMVPLALADELSLDLTAGEGIDFTCDEPSLPVDETNLVVKALQLFARETGTPRGYRAHLSKNIPSGAGLGGGSSDAAAALQLANALHGEPVSLEKLHELAARLGSDIPFFLGQGAQLCKGRGEILEPYRGPLPERVLLVKPPVGISTPWAYKRYAALKEKGELPVAEEHELGELLLVNDLERAVLPKYIILQTLKSWLTARDEVAAAMMSGSGSTVFAVLQQNHGGPAEAGETRLQHDLQQEFGKTFWTCVTEVQPGSTRSAR